MSWLFSQALVAAFLADTSSGGAPCAPSRKTPTADLYWFGDKTRATFNPSRYGMTCEHLMEDHGQALLTWFLGASRARIFRQPTQKPRDLTATDQALFGTCSEFVARFDPALFLWKTPQTLLLGGYQTYSDDWPRWGTIRAGALYRRPIPEHLTGETASGLWPTPVTQDSNKPDMRRQNRGFGLTLSDLVEAGRVPTPTASMHKGWAVKHSRAMKNDRLDYSAEREAYQNGTTGRLNPRWVEWLMGWPIGWASLNPLETARFHEWRRQHSVY